MDKIMRIESFNADHDKIREGMYISRKDGNITTYDLRTRKPNAGDYMNDLTIHSTEHMFATYIRNSEIGDKVIYFGPMGCRTGFYLLTAELEDGVVYDNVIKTLEMIIAHKGPVFGARRKECGNYRCLALTPAKREASRYLAALKARGKNFTYDK